MKILKSRTIIDSVGVLFFSKNVLEAVPEECFFLFVNALQHPFDIFLGDVRVVFIELLAVFFAFGGFVHDVAAGDNAQADCHGFGVEKQNLLGEVFALVEFPLQQQNERFCLERGL